MDNLKRLTGIVVPLGALYTTENEVIGEFADLIPFSIFCKNSGISLIQLLPINDTGTQSSPYSALSAFALHPIYLRLKDIPEFSNLYKTNQTFSKEYNQFIDNNKYSNRYDYDSILNSKIHLLRQIYETTYEGINHKPSEKLAKWIKNNDWVIQYSVYKKIKWDNLQASWKTWKNTEKNISKEEVLKLWNKEEFKKEHLFYAWCQMLCEEQFLFAVNEVKKQNILLKGDMPILMNEDSCDAWFYPEFFNQNLRAGSPSDGENPSGQNWGFPTYNWKNLATQNYSWWKDRLKIASKFYDAYRLDHILGFFRIWAINERDCNALNGHTEPYSSFKKTDLYELGFDDDRIRWLSKPHIPTKEIEDITWNHEIAHTILNIFCTRIENEELWLFKENIKGSQDFWDTDIISICKECSKENSDKIKQKLVEYWSNKTLLEIEKNKYIPMWTYGQSTSWNTLSDKEKESLLELFSILDKKNESLWKKQADNIFNSITQEINMIPCGEDLGVGIKCVPKTMKEHNILGLRVVRWCREWEKEEQPYVPFNEYEPLSVCTTSVHDSSTIRQWFEEENTKNNQTEFSEKTAYDILKESSSSKSLWFIPPLQDFLYLNKDYWLTKAEDERINIPGTVTKFNWTYRMPVCIEKLSADTKIQEKILEISKRN